MQQALKHDCLSQNPDYLIELGTNKFVFHSNLYLINMIKLADNASLMSGPKLMAEAAEESFFKVFMEHFRNHNIKKPELKIKIIENYYSQMGLGIIQINAHKINGTAILTESKIDSAWIKEFSKSKKPINFVTQGFLAAAFSAVFSKSIFSYDVIELESIAKGAFRSNFKIIKKH